MNLDEYTALFMSYAERDRKLGIKAEPIKKYTISKPTAKKIIKAVEHKSHNNMIIRQVAKLAYDEGLIEIGQNRLYKKLRDWKLIIPNTTEPYQKYIDTGYFVYVSTIVSTAYGDKVVKWTKVTPKGTAYILNRLREEITQY